MTNCTGLSKIKFPEICKDVHMTMCTGLVTAEFSEKCGNIYMQGCSKLKVVSFPKECLDIYLDDCENLVRIKLPQKYRNVYVNERTSFEVVYYYGEDDKFIYKIDGVEFPRVLFLDIIRGLLSAAEVFAIKDAKQRQIAYARMDKRKILELEVIMKSLMESENTHKHPVGVRP